MSGNVKEKSPFLRCNVLRFLLFAKPCKKFSLPYNGYYLLTPCMRHAMPNSTTSGITSVKLGHRKSDLAQIAGLQKRTVHSLVIEAVDRYIEQTQAKMRYEAQAIRSYENYQATGLHVTLDELQDWASSLDSLTPKPLPLCHK